MAGLLAPLIIEELVHDPQKGKFWGRAFLLSPILVTATSGMIIGVVFDIRDNKLNDQSTA